MTFTQTKKFFDMVNFFTDFANNHKYDEGKEQTAERIVNKWKRAFTNNELKAICKKANQKAKCKFYNV